MADNLIEQAAATLRAASESGVACSPVRDVLGTRTDVQMAYDVQRVNLDADLEAGRRVCGRKIGLTSTAVQQQLGVDQPDYGTLFADMCLPDGIDIPSGSLIAPRAEAEIALVLRHDLDRGSHCVLDIIDAVAYALPAIEVVDSRIADWNISLVDTIADNASCGLFVVGSRPVPLSDIDVVGVEVELYLNGSVESTGTGSACLGNPLHAAVWLADKMSEIGDPLRAGECIMTGALGPMIPLNPGDRVHADMGPLGTVSTRYGDADAASH